MPPARKKALGERLVTLGPIPAAGVRLGRSEPGLANRIVLIVVGSDHSVMV
jgi:hypothetical protein